MQYKMSKNEWIEIGNKTGWMKKIAQAPTAAQTAQAVQKAQAEQQQAASQAMQAATGKPLSADPNAQAQQMANIGRDAAMNMANKAGLQGSNVKEMFSNALGKSGLAALAKIFNYTEQDLLDDLANPQERQRMKENLQNKINRITTEPRKPGYPDQALDTKLVTRYSQILGLINSAEKGMAPAQALQYSRDIGEAYNQSLGVKAPK